MGRGNNRMVGYFAGFLIGMMLVSLILSRRAGQEEERIDPWVAHNMAMLDAGAAPLPDRLPEALRAGRLFDYGTLPLPEGDQAKVWLLNFDDSYPFVRVQQSEASGKLEIMAADQVVVELAEGVDVTELKPMLDELGLRLRMFNRKGGIAVVGVLHTEISAVPDTIEAMSPWGDLFRDVRPDWIRIRREADSY